MKFAKQSKRITKNIARYLNNSIWKINTIFTILAFFILAGVFLFFQYYGSVRSEEKRPLEAHSLSILEKCQTSSHRPSCYDKEIPKLMDRISMEEAFQVTRMVQERDQNYWYCHVLGHELSAKETAKDPERWKDVVTRCPQGMCSNGCLHGAFQEKFRAESLPEAGPEELVSILKGICSARPDWNPTGLERGTCYHALGHLTMYVTQADIDKSAKLCEAVLAKDGAKNFLQICYDGIFMQIFQPLEPEDFALVQGKQPAKDGVQNFCWKYRGEKRGSCWSESWPLYFEEVTVPEGLMKFCGKLSGDSSQEDRCFKALFFVLPTQFRFEDKAIQNFCSRLPRERSAQCFANAAARFIETDARLIEKSAALCNFASTLEVGEGCFEELLVYSTYNFHAGSPEFYRLCNALPDGWKDGCLSKQ